MCRRDIKPSDPAVAPQDIEQLFLDQLLHCRPLLPCNPLEQVPMLLIHADQDLDPLGLLLRSPLPYRRGLLGLGRLLGRSWSGTRLCFVEAVVDPHEGVNRALTALQKKTPLSRGR
jgi:hypothetical protein